MSTLKDNILKDYRKMAEERAEDTMYSYDDLLEQSLSFLESVISQVREETLKEVEDVVEDLSPDISAGQCPSCNNPRILGLHPIDTDEHIGFYRKGLTDSWEAIEKLSIKAGNLQMLSGQQSRNKAKLVNIKKV